MISLATHRRFSLESAGFPYDIRLYEEAQNWNIVAAILNSIQEPARVFVTSFRPREFVRIASEEPF